jgi:DNA polymerase-1
MIYFTSTNIDQSILNVDSIKLISVQEVLQKISDQTILCLDTETTALNFLESKIIMLQIGTGEDQLVIDTRDFDITLFKDVLEDPNKTFVGHNLKFDYNQLKNYGIVLSNVWDTMVVDQVLHNGKYNMEEIRKLSRFSLKGVYQYYFHKVINKAVREEFSTIRNRPFTLQQVMYGATDVVLPLQIKQKQEELASIYNLQSCIRLENQVVLALGDIEYNGMYLDIDKWMSIVHFYLKKIKATEAELDQLLLSTPTGSKYRKLGNQLDLFDSSFDDKRLSIVNWASDQQVLKILHQEYNIFPKDKDGKDSSGADAIEFLPEKIPITTKLLEHRKESKIISSFGENYIKKYIQKDGRIHTTYNQIVRTGRMSSRNPNIQQLKKGDGFRETFTVTGNKTLICADYSAQEARIMADLANDEAYINFFKSGDSDPHSFVASRMYSVAFGKEFIVTKDNENKAYRDKGKTLNFAVSFGASAFTIAKRLKISEEEAQGLIDLFFQGFPGLDNFFKECRESGLKKGYITTNEITRRIRWFPKHKRLRELSDKRSLTREERKELLQIKGSIGRESQNTRIQGSASDVSKTALILLRKELLKNNINSLNTSPVKIVNCIHDEIILECDIELAEQWATTLKDCMEKAAKIYCKHLDIPAVPVISKIWEH